MEGRHLFRPEDTLLNRGALLVALNAREPDAKGSEKFLVIVNIADTARYEEVVALFGYEFVDQLLAIRLDDLKPQLGNNPVYHLGFWTVGFIHEVRRGDTPGAFLDHLAFCLNRPAICRGVPVPFKPGIGVCGLAQAAGTASDLLQSTFLAAQASSRGTSAWQECAYDGEHGHRRAFSIIADVEPSLRSRADFELNFQARLHLPSQRFVCAEALLRWRHPTLGVISPNEFVPLVEKTGLIRELTFWVLSNAIEQAALWRRNGSALRVAVNISSKNLDEDDFIERVQALLAEHALDANFLELEFSETRMFANPELAKRKLSELRRLGIGISIDDFGIGLHSLANLGEIPAGAVNIDGSLIAGLRSNQRARAVVRAIIGLAHDLDIAVVGKMIESDAVLKQLAGWSCDYGQGYLFCRPMRAAEFLDWAQVNCDV